MPSCFDIVDSYNRNEIYNNEFIENLFICCQIISRQHRKVHPLPMSDEQEFLWFFTEEMYKVFTRRGQKIKFCYLFLKDCFNITYKAYCREIQFYDKSKKFSEYCREAFPSDVYRRYIKAQTDLRQVEVKNYIKSLLTTIKNYVINNCKVSDTSYIKDCYISILLTFYKKRLILMRPQSEFKWEVKCLYKGVLETLWNDIKELIGLEEDFSECVLRGDLLYGSEEDEE